MQRTMHYVLRAKRSRPNVIFEIREVSVWIFVERFAIRHKFFDKRKFDKQQ